MYFRYLLFFSTVLLNIQAAHAAPENRCYWDGQIAVHVVNPHSPFGSKQVWHMPDPTCDMYLIESAHWEWCEVSTGFFGGYNRKCHHRDDPDVERLIERLTRHEKRWEFEIINAGFPTAPLAIDYIPDRAMRQHRYLVDNSGEPIGLLHYEYFPEDYEQAGRNAGE
jgi:hypothetical protein